MTSPCYPAPAKQLRVRISSSASNRSRLRFKRSSLMDFLALQAELRSDQMSDYESDDLIRSTPLVVTDPRPPPSANRRSARLAFCRSNPSPSSHLRACGISPGSDLEPSHLTQLTDLLPLHGSSPSPPPPPSASSGKRLRKSANPPAKRRRGRPASTPVSAPAPPGPITFQDIHLEKEQRLLQPLEFQQLLFNNSAAGHLQPSHLTFVQTSRPSSKICCPALGHESASGTPTTSDRSEASPKPDTGHSSSAEPAASSPRPIQFRHPDFG
ncbi:hypothetical protein CRENBAI_001098 [Crenichthys baileyi]|uniref:Uncharacterized protein n=1 Tax=Crenichthys baileyi TaxID=28760 RepID=A0AAV9R5I6_9TELE